MLCFPEMQTEEDGEEGISDAVHAQMQAKWKELSKKRCVFFSCIYYTSGTFFFLSVMCVSYFAQEPVSCVSIFFC